MHISEEDFKRYFSTWLIILDTFHRPDTRPFEREWLARLRGIGFKGILLLDDIFESGEMKGWWKELQANASEWGYAAYDLTSIGHSTGTGLLDFTGRVKIIE
jgi:hypothetical protein